MAAVYWDDRGEERWVRLEGELDYATFAETEALFRDAIRCDAKTVFADMSAVTFLVSQAIWMLLEAHKDLREDGRQLVLTGLRPRLHKTLDTVGVFQVVPEWTALTPQPRVD